jgi:Protein of unknown function (DUF4197)
MMTGPALGLVLVLAASPAQAPWDKIWTDLGKAKGLSNETVVSGLKEALRIGSGNAVSLNGKVDGYFKNVAIKILMPEKLKPVEKGLRMAGQSRQVDEFVLGMNRAAEKAAPFAKDIFWGAIKRMTFSDATRILKGGDTAATDYFRGVTTDELTTAFEPIVKESMESIGVTRQYKVLAGRYNALPFVKSQAFDLDRYVVDKALDGLFYVLAEEERKIRTNPAARVTDLLRTVFGK